MNEYVKGISERKDKVFLDELVEKLIECEAVRTEEGGIEIVLYGEETTTNILIEEIEEYPLGRPKGKGEGKNPLKTLIEQLEELIE